MEFFSHLLRAVTAKQHVSKIGGNHNLARYFLNL